MGQINTKKTATFDEPGNERRGYGFTIEGVPVMIDEEGVTTELLTTTELSVLGILANAGIGLEADLPFVSASAVYITTDSFKVYYANSVGTGWLERALILGEMITDTSLANYIVYQYIGGLTIIGGLGIVGSQIFEATEGQTEFTITDFTVVERALMGMKEGVVQSPSFIDSVALQVITITPAASKYDLIMFKQ